MEMKKKYDVAIIGNWSGYNYGAHLTHYALYSFLTESGYKVLMVEKTDTEPFRPLTSPQLFRNNPYPEGSLSKLYSSLLEAKELNEICDTFIVGSDQLWNYKLFGHGMESYTLAYVYEEKKKISYATSFGADVFECPADYKKRFEFLLSRFDYVSVREESGVDICDEMGIEATRVLDPVFLCDRRIYNDMASKSLVSPTEPYIFAYILYPSAEKEVLLQKIADEKHMKIICVGDALFKQRYSSWNIEKIDNCLVEDWLNLIKNSQFVIADSFHAYCFSIIYEKQIISCAGTNYTAGRMKSLSSFLGVNNVYLAGELVNHTYSEIQKLTNVDYELVRGKIKDKIEFSRKWLLDAIAVDKKKQASNIDKFWDAYGVTMIDSVKELMRLKKEYRTDIFRNKYKDCEVAIFGAGANGRFFYQNFMNYMNISCFVDNSSDLWDTRIQEIKCIQPCELKKIQNLMVVISIQDLKIVKEIEKQLEEMGIYNYVHVNKLFNEIEVNN